MTIIDRNFWITVTNIKSTGVRELANVENTKGIRQPRQPDGANRNKPHPEFCRQGKNDPLPNCNTESTWQALTEATNRYQMNKGRCTGV